MKQALNEPFQYARIQKAGEETGGASNPLIDMTLQPVSRQRSQPASQPHDGDTKIQPYGSHIQPAITRHCMLVTSQVSPASLGKQTGPAGHRRRLLAYVAGSWLGFSPGIHDSLGPGGVQQVIRRRDSPLLDTRSFPRPCRRGYGKMDTTHCLPGSGGKEQSGHQGTSQLSAAQCSSEANEDIILDSRYLIVRYSRYTNTLKTYACDLLPLNDKLHTIPSLAEPLICYQRMQADQMTLMKKRKN